MSTTPAKCESCNYNGGSKPNNTTPVGPIVPGVNYDFNLDSTSIPENLLDYRLGSLLLAFCIIVECFCKQRETRDYRVPIVHLMKDHLERSGYACGGSVAVDVYFMEVV